MKNKCEITTNRTKLRIAQEAARIIIDEGIEDYLIAKRKAAIRLDLSYSELPRNEDIEIALVEYHKIFRAENQPSHLKKLRKTALEAMNFFQAFSPKLVGTVLNGTAGKYSPIVLHLHPPTAEEVLLKLINTGLPFKEKSRIINRPNNRTVEYPAFQILLNETEVVLLILPVSYLYHPPFGKTLARAGRKHVDRLIAADNHSND